MSYFHHMIRVLKLDKDVYKDIANQERAMVYTMVNVGVLGLLYSLSSLGFTRFILPEGTLDSAHFNPLMIIMVGISLAFLVHAGASLFIWVFCRGIGGNPRFVAPYMHMGIASISMWFMAPVLSAFQAGIRNPVLYVYLFLSVLYAGIVFFKAVREATGLSIVKMSIASAASVMYIGCFLYLWV